MKLFSALMRLIKKKPIDEKPEPQIGRYTVDQMMFTSNITLINILQDDLRVLERQMQFWRNAKQKVPHDIIERYYQVKTWIVVLGWESWGMHEGLNDDIYKRIKREVIEWIYFDVRYRWQDEVDAKNSFPLGYAERGADEEEQG
jgi:hypothetical protein